jgi:hypothetical protein
VAATRRSARGMACGVMADSTNIMVHASTVAGGTLAVRSSAAAGRPAAEARGGEGWRRLKEGARELSKAGQVQQPPARAPPMHKGSAAVQDLTTPPYSVTAGAGTAQ